EQREVAGAAEEMGSWLDTQIMARSGRAGDDLISVLLRAEEEGGALTPDELSVFVVTLLVAGSITTAYLIGSAARLVAEEPARLVQLREDAARFVEETLRYETPTQLMFRTATTHLVMGGAAIPQGATRPPLPPS